MIVSPSFGSFMSTFATFTDDGLTNENARVLRLGLETAKALGMVVSVHAEDAGLRADGVMNEGPVSEELGLPGNPAAAAAARVARDMELVALTGARLHVPPGGEGSSGRAGLHAVPGSTEVQGGRPEQGGMREPASDLSCCFRGSPGMALPGTAPLAIMSG